MEGVLGKLTLKAQKMRPGKKKKKMGNNCKVHEKLKNKKKCAFKYMNKKNK